MAHHISQVQYRAAARLDNGRMETVGQRIKRLRLAGDVKQQRLADLVGVNQSTISNIERDNVDLTAAYLYKIAEALNVSSDEIWLGSPGEDMNTFELTRIYRSLSDQDRETLLRLARALAPQANSRAA